VNSRSGPRRHGKRPGPNNNERYQVKHSADSLLDALKVIADRRLSEESLCVRWARSILREHSIGGEQ
jgi:hypothetical protein